MAILYINDGGSDTSPYDTWAKAANLTESALVDAACVAGSTVYVQSDHVEANRGADVTLASLSGIAANPVTIISVTNTNEPPLAADYQTMMVGGGSIDTTDGAWDITLNGWDIWVGLHFKVGDDLKAPTAARDTRFNDCKFEVADNVIITYSDTFWEWINCDYVQTTGGHFRINGGFIWNEGSYSWAGGGSVPVDLFSVSNTRGAHVTISDVEFADLNADDYLVNDMNETNNVLFKRCKIPAACGYMDAGPTGMGSKVKFHSVDDGNFIYKFKEYYFEGKIEDAINCHLNATYDGTNGYSVKMTSNANAKEWTRPLRFKLAEVWCNANPTLTVEVITAGVTLQNDEFWIEIEYPDATTGALGKIDRTCRPTTILTAAANLTTSTAGWTEDLGGEVKQKISEIIDGGQAGIHTVWACLAKPSITVYACPKITVT